MDKFLPTILMWLKIALGHAPVISEHSIMNTVYPDGDRRSGALSMCSARQLVWVIAVCLTSLVHGAVLNEGQVTRFQRTAQYLQGADPQLRSEFAAIALSSLAGAYFSEARLAREEARKGGQNEHLLAWSVRVDRYANQMPLLLNDIELGFPVSLTFGGEKALAITVADRTVILSHPRLYEQNAFEQSILVSFCTQHSCEQFAPQNEEAGPIPLSTVKVRPNWSFTARQSSCAYQGITVQFKSARNMVNSRLICEQFMQEVTTLADELAWQQRHAVLIEWDQLEIQPTPRRPEHMLQLNSLGDTVLVTVPVLYRSSGLFRQVLPWVRRRVTLQEEASIELDAEDYGWQKP